MKLTSFILLCLFLCCYGYTQDTIKSSKPFSLSYSYQAGWVLDDKGDTIYIRGDGVILKDLNNIRTMVFNNDSFSVNSSYKLYSTSGIDKMKIPTGYNITGLTLVGGGVGFLAGLFYAAITAGVSEAFNEPYGKSKPLNWSYVIAPTMIGAGLAALYGVIFKQFKTSDDYDLQRLSNEEKQRKIKAIINSHKN